MVGLSRTRAWLLLQQPFNSAQTKPDTATRRCKISFQRMLVRLTLRTLQAGPQTGRWQVYGKAITRASLSLALVKTTNVFVFLLVNTGKKHK